MTRSGDSSLPVAVDFATSDTAGLTSCSAVTGIASSRCDYETAIGTLNFGAGVVSKTFDILVIDDVYVEGNETFTVTLSNPNGINFSLGSPSTATVTITDNDSSPGAPNPIDNTQFFVRQHYLDFLNREPDPPGLTGWVNTINNCAAGDTSCDRVHVSEAFFKSNEFQQRGYFVYRFYPVAFGRKPNYLEFMPDLGRLSGFLDAGQLETAKLAFIAEFMSRPAFVAAYNFPNNSTGNQQYVDKLLQTAAVTLAQRQTLIDGLNNGTLTRAQVLRQIVESSEVATKYFNQAFVVTEYFGYLRRDPDAFYLNWLAFLDANPGSSRTMVSGFMNSQEYRQRFGP